MSRRHHLVLLLVATAALSPAGHAQRSTETRSMSDQASPSALERDVNSALATYDRTRSADALRDAVDAVTREDGTVPADPAAALAMGRMRLRLWIAVLSRFARDLDPDFDPAHPPPTSIAPPEINGEQMMPGTKPEDIADPKTRRAYEAAVAKNNERVKNFAAMYRLSQIHATTVERAAGSLRNARDTLGMPTAEIAATLRKSAIAAPDKSALVAAVE